MGSFFCPIGVLMRRVPLYQSSNQVSVKIYSRISSHCAYLTLCEMKNVKFSQFMI